MHDPYQGRKKHRQLHLVNVRINHYGPITLSAWRMEGNTSNSDNLFVVNAKMNTARKTYAKPNGSGMHGLPLAET